MPQFEMTSTKCSDTLPPRLSAKYEGSFAYFTIRDRLPVILTKVIDTLYTYRIKAAQQYGEEGAADCKSIVSSLAKFRNELQTDKPVLPLESNEGADSQIWQRYLEEETQRNGGRPPSWFQSPWLYVECYMYRRIVESIRLSKHLKSFDPFRELKDTALETSQDALVILAKYLQSTSEENGKAVDLFTEFVQISLWGNKCDLSISAGIENSQKISPLSQLKELRDKILVDDTEKLWHVLEKARERKAENGKVRLDIVLDNAGFELFTDLCLAEFALHTNAVDTVVLHYKAMPWFVSDVGRNDFMHTLNFLEHHENKVLQNLSKTWTERLQTGSWILQGHLFWTTPHDYSEMRSVSPELYSELSNSDLVLLKGDLNYRKLVGDRQWEHTVPYAETLCGFHPAPHCALRTNKADVIVGLEEGVTEQIEAVDKDWMIDGKYAVIQFCGVIQN
ncbi:protein-glutamate O-methyltransferase-like [Acanthaster planci]|uniref:Sugar phosphate phosphatase n=1 Tax=Acanthaster planci TaxID=133434 RepID=A0A8B7XQG2_ACAPL|nr:protein-glutamate O-methyltransferase-like [Acanthaster planci]